MIDLERSLVDYAEFLEERSLARSPVDTAEIGPDPEVPLIPIQESETTEMKRKHWGMLSLAAAIVVAVVIVGGVVIASNSDDDDSEDLATEPTVEFDIVGWWEYTDRPMGDSPMEQVRQEYHADGTYAMIAWPDVRADHGRYEFEDDLLTIHHDGGRGCEKLDGNPIGVYRLTVTSDDAFTLELVSDECSARPPVLDGAQLARVPAG